MMSLYKPEELLENQTSSSSSSSTGARARAREGLELLADCYRDTLGRQAPGIVVEEMAGMLDQGIEPCVVMMALDETAAAPRPSWAYCRAILQACLREGVRTAEGWRDRQARWAGRARPGRDYQERSYSDADRRRRFVDLERE